MPTGTSLAPKARAQSMSRKVGEMKEILHRAKLVSTASVILMATSLGCSSDGSPSAPTDAVLQVEMTDAPTDDLSAVNVYISGLTIKPSGGSVQRIASDVGRVDLLSLRGRSELLVTAGVQAGDYEFIQVELEQGASSVVDAATGEELPLQIASQEIKVLGTFTVVANATTTALLDFDADDSLMQVGNGEWLLNPVILLANVSSS